MTSSLDIYGRKSNGRLITFVSALEFGFVSAIYVKYYQVIYRTNHFTENNLSQNNTFQYLF